MNAYLYEFPQHLRDQLSLIFHYLYIGHLVLLRLEVPVNEVLLSQTIPSRPLDLRQVKDDKALQLDELVVSDDHPPFWWSWECVSSSRWRSENPSTRPSCIHICGRSRLVEARVCGIHVCARHFDILTTLVSSTRNTFYVLGLVLVKINIVLVDVDDRLFE